ncbi:MAG: hypothetical protein JJ908_13450 [Rhizobiales bacterium]|nr:hypothetical protein [Hyphomicrobiales bacterium]MBO6699831.1 hypothetical protein [Hyphomicrobiales bacterium]MBO6737369.1 hypothetical protein [Hyphomicrobiales bacterium]MBO6911557.1 hypothetical protein [Hyphomicrobiales bacterium]MBO6955143.1 hypothetical protein [Hyphomicrobiales bacterium]
MPGVLIVSLWTGLALTFLILVVLVVTGLAGWRALDKRAEARVMAALHAVQPETPPVFDMAMVEDLPEPAQRYFRFTIAPGTPLYTVVDIEMEGRLSLGTADAPNWMEMTARQVLGAPDGFLWQPSTSFGGLSMSGSDAALRGTSWTRFWLLGLFPVVRAGGNDDHARAAFGRYVGEALFWTPAALLPRDGIVWESLGENSARMVLTAYGMEQPVEVHVDARGAPTRIVFPRWSDANPQKQFQIQPFGGDLSEYRTFEGFTLPTVVNAGNFYGTDDYFPFFQVRVTSVSFPPASRS